jgi:hypothetical protein
MRSRSNKGRVSRMPAGSGDRLRYCDVYVAGHGFADRSANYHPRIARRLRRAATERSVSNIPAQADSMTCPNFIVKSERKSSRPPGSVYVRQKSSLVSTLAGRRRRKFFGAGHPHRARSHDGLRQLCRPGRGVSGSARRGNCDRDHAGSGTSGAIGLQLVVKLRVLELVDFVGFLVHRKRHLDFTVGF